MQACDALVGEFENWRDNRMNDVMYALTVVTTIFLPGQFLAGVYGMNFEHMPELDYTYGYPVFWVVLFLVVSVMYMSFKWCKHWI